MKKEIKIEDFISKDELDNMTDKEREISERMFLLNKQELQELTDEFDMMNEINDKLNNILDKLNNK
jgi:ferric iron reductase protein FhuF